MYITELVPNDYTVHPSDFHPATQGLNKDITGHTDQPQGMSVTVSEYLWLSVVVRGCPWLPVVVSSDSKVDLINNESNPLLSLFSLLVNSPKSP